MNDLLDFYAAAALQGLLANNAAGTWDEKRQEEIAKTAFEIAVAALAERSRHGFYHPARRAGEARHDR